MREYKTEYIIPKINQANRHANINQANRHAINQANRHDMTSTNPMEVK